MSDEQEERPTKRKMLEGISLQVLLARMDGDGRGELQKVTLVGMAITLVLVLATFILALQTASEVKYLREDVAAFRKKSG